MTPLKDFIKLLAFSINCARFKSNLFFRDLVFLEFNLSLLLQQGQRIPTDNESTNMPHTEQGLCPTANLYPPSGFFAANL